MTEQDRIFLGHANEDKPRVLELYHRLKAEGLAPWLDVEDLIPGQNWRNEIPRAIKSAKIFLACLSQHSIAKQGYVQREFRTALSAYAELPPDTIYLIPVRLDECEVPDLRLPELELNLRDLHWVDLFNENGFSRLVKAIRLNSATDPRADEDAGGALVFPTQDFEIFKSLDAPWCPEMVMLPAGRFLMGSPENEAERFDWEGPQHEVMISRLFALGRYAVTFEEYDYFCEAAGREQSNDRGWGRGRRPVINVSHDDASAYCAWLSEATGTRYRLPTEAMWEYACRAGTATTFSFGETITPEQVTHDGNYPYGDSPKGLYRQKTVEVGSLPTNPWGLHEMHGNVWEWVSDWNGDYSSDAVTDPEGPATGTSRVVRGGSWFVLARSARSAIRLAAGPGYRYDNLGFRCAGVQEQS